MLSVSYVGKNAYSASKTSGVLRAGALEADRGYVVCWPTVGYPLLVKDQYISGFFFWRLPLWINVTVTLSLDFNIVSTQKYKKIESRYFDILCQNQLTMCLMVLIHNPKDWVQIFTYVYYHIKSWQMLNARCFISSKMLNVKTIM